MTTVTLTLRVDQVTPRGGLLLRVPGGLSSSAQWEQARNVTTVTDDPVVEGQTREFTMRHSVAKFHKWVN